MMANILQIALWFFVWILLTWPIGRYDIVIGLVVAFFVFFMTQDMLTTKPSPFRNPMRYLWFLYYIVVFLWQCILANLDVAYRVLHPDMPIRPGTLRIKTVLKSDAGLTFLANFITLTPGTTTVDVDRDNGFIYVHQLYVRKGYDVSSMRLPMVERLERILQRIFG